MFEIDRNDNLFCLVIFVQNRNLNLWMIRYSVFYLKPFQYFFLVAS